MRRSVILATALAVAGSLAACGGKLDTGTFARMEIRVDDRGVESGDSSDFPLALQTSTSKDVEVVNIGTDDLEIASIDWKRGDTGQPIKNEYIEIDWRGAVGPNSFPYVLSPEEVGGLSFAIKFTPPLGMPLDDFDDSVLVIDTNARDANGDPIGVFEITFGIEVDSPFPRVTPVNYTFTSATEVRPERQEFTIYNDPALATAPFHVLGVRLETPSDEFTLLNVPSDGATVLAPGNPEYQVIVFTVEYRPKDATPDSNAIIIETDATAGGQLRVPLSTNSQTGSYDLTFSHASELDFTTTSQKETREVYIVSEGPSAMAIREPRIEPEEARLDYTYKAYVPATQQGVADELIVGWDGRPPYDPPVRGFAPGRSLRLEVTFEPHVGGGDTANGELRIPYEAGTAVGTIVIPMLSGDPKSKIELAPKTGSVVVTGDAAGGESGTRNAVIYNYGNGTLQLVDVAVKGPFAGVDPRVFGLGVGFTAADVPPGGLLVVPLDYALAGLPAPSSTEQEVLEITYYNDFTGQNETITLGLVASGHGGAALPVADPGAPSDYADAVVGEPVLLDGAGSTGGAGTIDDTQGYVWYLTGKPASSDARLNLQSGSLTTFTPDVAGAYTVELFTYAQTTGGDYYYSEPASVTVTVAP